MQVSNEKLFVMGSSLGSVPSSFIATQWRTNPVGGLILMSPLESVYALIRRKGKELLSYSSNADKLNQHDNMGILRRGCPWSVLIAHGVNDDVVPISASRNLIKALKKTPRDKDS